MKAEKPYLSIIVPVFNESKRLFNLKQICEYFRAHEIIIVDDGSTDDTLRQLARYQNKFNIKIISYPKNRGKGFAVRQGMLNASGKYRLFMDIDLSVKPKTWKEADKYLNPSSVLIGVRRLPKSRIVIHQPWLRENLGRVFTWLSQTILSVPVKDFTCGFKIFPQKAALEIFSLSRIDRWGFDSEIIYLAHKLGYKIIQLPVSWFNDQNTRVNIAKDGLNSLGELLQIKTYSLLGAYTLTLT